MGIAGRTGPLHQGRKTEEDRGRQSEHGSSSPAPGRDVSMGSMIHLLWLAGLVTASLAIDADFLQQEDSVAKRFWPGKRSDENQEMTRRFWPGKRSDENQEMARRFWLRKRSDNE